MGILKNKKGFTLLEVMITFFISVILFMQLSSAFKSYRSIIINIKNKVIINREVGAAKNFMMQGLLNCDHLLYLGVNYKWRLYSDPTTVYSDQIYNSDYKILTSDFNPGAGLSRTMGKYVSSSTFTIVANLASVNSTFNKQNEEKNLDIRICFLT